MSGNNKREAEDEVRDVQAWRTDLSVPVPLPGRATRVASWIGWHLPELAGVTVPAVAGVAVSPWALLVSGVVGAGWTVHACRSGREQAAIKAGRDLPALSVSTSGEDEASEDGGLGSVEDSAVSDAPVSGVDGKRVEGGAR